MPAEVIEGILLETHKMLLTGPSKAGKTWCLINLAVSVATGGWWIDFRCAQRKVLYVDLETDPRTLQKRVSRVAEAKSDANACERWIRSFGWERYSENEGWRIIGLDTAAPAFRERDGSGRFVWAFDVTLTVVRSL